MFSVITQCMSGLSYKSSSKAESRNLEQWTLPAWSHAGSWSLCPVTDLEWLFLFFFFTVSMILPSFVVACSGCLCQFHSLHHTVYSVVCIPYNVKMFVFYKIKGHFSLMAWAGWEWITPSHDAGATNVWGCDPQTAARFGWGFRGWVLETNWLKLAALLSLWNSISSKSGA